MEEKEIAESAVALCGRNIVNAGRISELRDRLTVDGEEAVLLWLWQKDKEEYAVNITEQFGLTAGRVANIIKKLEQRGYILREQDEDDKRRVKIRLMQEGSAAAEGSYNRLLHEQKEFIRGLGNENLQKLLDLYQAVLGE